LSQQVQSPERIGGEQASSFLPALICGGTIFVQAFDSASINTAFPAMAKSLGERPLSLNLVITVYLIAATAALPLSSWITDYLGAKRAFLLSILAFGLGAVGCALSDSLAQMVVFRLVQGAASALALPVARIIALRAARQEDTIRVIAALTTPVNIAPMVGAPVAGVLVTYLSWRWIFWADVAGCLVLLTLVARFISAHPPVRRPFDWPGAVALTTALLAFTSAIAMSPGTRTGVMTAGLLTLSAAALGVYLVLMKRSKHPIVDLTLFRFPTFTLVALAGLLGRSISRAGPFLLALLFQVGFGFTAAKTGLFMLFGALGSLVTRPVLMAIIGRLGFRRALILNLWVVGATFAATALIGAETAFVLVTVLMFAQGLARSVQMVGLSSLSFADIPDARLSDASGLSSICQQVAGNIGLAAAMFSLQLVTGLSRADLHAADIKLACVLIAAFSMLALPFYLRLQDDAGSQLAGTPSYRPRREPPAGD
jgi:MFS family permease